MVELPVLGTPGSAAVGEPRLPHASEDGLELGLGDMERVVLATELRIVVKQKRQAVVDLHRRKMLPWPRVGEPEELGELPSRRLLVTGRDNGVVEGNRHAVLLSPAFSLQRSLGTPGTHVHRCCRRLDASRWDLFVAPCLVAPCLVAPCLHGCPCRAARLRHIARVCSAKANVAPWPNGQMPGEFPLMARRQGLGQ